jgi:hypothetical protein
MLLRGREIEFQNSCERRFSQDGKSGPRAPLGEKIQVCPYVPEGEIFSPGGRQDETLKILSTIREWQTTEKLGRIITPLSQVSTITFTATVVKKDKGCFVFHAARRTLNHRRGRYLTRSQSRNLETPCSFGSARSATATTSPFYGAIRTDTPFAAVFLKSKDHVWCLSCIHQHYPVRHFVQFEIDLSTDCCLFQDLAVGVKVFCCELLLLRSVSGGVTLNFLDANRCW